MHFMNKKKNISCLNKTCLSRGGCWRKEPLAGRLCRTRGECSPHLEYLQVSPIRWALGADVKHVWSVAPGVLCLSQPAVTALGLPLSSETSWSWRGAVPCCCRVLQTTRGAVSHWTLGPTVPCPQPAFGTGWEPHPSAGYCPSDDLCGCVGASRYSHSKRGCGFILWKPFQLPKGASSALPLHSAGIGSAPRKGHASSTGLGLCGPCPTQCFAGKYPEKGGGRKIAADSREAPGTGPLVEAAAGLCVPSPARGSLPESVCGYSLLCSEPRRPLPVCPVTFSHVLLLS